MSTSTRTAATGNFGGGVTGASAQAKEVFVEGGS
jgi:hypothetical protein